jgi:hypothetical protein
MRAAAPVSGAQGFSGGAVHGTPVGEEATLSGQGSGGESSAEWTTRARWRGGDGGENGELESGVHPLSPRKAVDGERHDGETRGGNQQWWPQLERRRCGLGADVRTVRLSSGPNKVLIFFQFIQNWLNFKNSK